MTEPGYVEALAHRSARLEEHAGLDIANYRPVTDGSYVEDRGDNPELNHDGRAPFDVMLLARSIGDVSGMAWSPDGRWLAFDGDPDGRGQGIWLFDIEADRLIEAVSGPAGDFATYAWPEWSPDGRWLVFQGSYLDTGRQNLSDDRTALYVLDVSEIVAGDSR